MRDHAVAASHRPPPSTKRGVELTSEEAAVPTAGLHWYAATTMRTIDDVLGFISETFCGSDFTVLDHGVNGYTRTHTTIYGLRIFDNPGRSEMGVHIIADGDATEAIGHSRLQLIHFGLEMRPTRVDVALDHCPFDPADVYAEWLRDNVRTRCKAPSETRPDRSGLRAHTWMSSPRGDTFYMGSRQSTAFAKCYDERGHTRFELELKEARARAAVQLLFEPDAPVGPISMGLVRDFVDYVDKESSKNRSRCSLLPFWAALSGRPTESKSASRRGQSGPWTRWPTGSGRKLPHLWRSMRFGSSSLIGSQETSFGGSCGVKGWLD